MPDRVSDYLAQWAAVRPELDVSPMGIVGRLSRAAQLFGDTIHANFANAGLARGEFDLLATLRRSGEPYTLTPGELAASTMATNATTTDRLRRLEARALLVRATDLENRRRVLVTLTTAGVELVDRLVEGHVALEQQLVSVLTDKEQRRLAKLLEMLLERSGDLSVVSATTPVQQPARSPRPDAGEGASNGASPRHAPTAPVEQAPRGEAGRRRNRKR